MPNIFDWLPWRYWKHVEALNNEIEALNISLHEDVKAVEATVLKRILLDTPLGRPALNGPMALWKVIIRWNLTEEAIRLLEGVRVEQRPELTTVQFLPPDVIGVVNTFDPSGDTMAHETFHAYFWRKWLLPTPDSGAVNQLIADTERWIATIGAPSLELRDREADLMRRAATANYSVYMLQPRLEGKPEDPDHMFVRTAIDMRGKLDKLPEFMKPWYGGLFTGKPLELA